MNRIILARILEDGTIIDDGIIYDSPITKILGMIILIGLAICAILLILTILLWLICGLALFFMWIGRKLGVKPKKKKKKPLPLNTWSYGDTKPKKLIYKIDEK